jgi:predicted RNase H-like HicB family nuclease
MRHDFHVVYTEIEGGWIVAQAPELPGAVTQGRTLEVARELIAEAIQLLLESYRANAERDAPGNAIWETITVDTASS